METTNALLVFILIYGGITVLIVTFVVIWALRTGQFKHPERGSGLPLDIEESEKETDKEKKEKR